VIQWLCVDTNILKVSIKHITRATSAANKENTVNDIWTDEIHTAPVKQYENG